MKHIAVKNRAVALCCFLLVMCCAFFANDASAEIIDDIVLKADANGEVDAIVKFTVPVRFVRYFPLRKSPYVAIYFDILNSVPRDEWQNYESHRSPPSDLILGFTVTTRDLSTGPKIEVQFKRPVEITTVREGRDGRSIVMHVKPEVMPEKESKPQTGLPAAGVLAIPAVVPSVPKPAVPVPAGSSSTGRVAATQQPVPASAVVAVPAPTPAPVLSLASASAPAAPIQFAPPPPVQSLAVTSAPVAGEKVLPATRLSNELPIFPALEIPPTTPQTAPMGASLADQIRIANGQAAVLMLKGRDAIVAGRMFEAVDAFNSVLKLPTNRYTEAAQVWIGIAREMGGQAPKARLEFELYLKLYPNGTDAAWVKGRLALLNRLLPSPAAPIAPAVAAAGKEQPREPAQPYQKSGYGSLSMYYYQGNSQTTTVTTVGTTQTPTTLTATDQSSLITNVMATDRFYNNQNEFRLVFQDFYSKNFLNTPGSTNTNRLNALYGEWKSRIDNAYARVGRQAAIGGGVMGRFDGASAGYGPSRDWRVNVVGGQLSDQTLGPKPIFYGTSVDFGMNDPAGGSLYAINQTVGGVLDRRAVGGTLRYFSPRATALSIFDYDTQFKQWNMVTVQGTLNNGAEGATYNFLFDRRRSPSLSIRNAVNGTTASLTTLMQNGWTQQDLITLAQSRDAVTNTGQIGVTVPLREKLQSGTDLIVSNTSGVPSSGTLNPDGTTGLEGFVAATVGSGNAWTLSQRLIVNDLIVEHDVSMASVSLTKSKLLSGKTLLFNNHAMPQELWTLDTSLRFYWQTDYLGGKEDIVAPTIKVGYRVKTSLTLESEYGLEWTKNNPSALVSSKITRQYVSFGFRWDF